MGQPAAKQGDRVTATDTHVIMVPSPGGAIPTPTPHPFNGILSQNLSPNVYIGGMAAATVGSIAMNTPPHVPQGGPFQRPPSNQGRIEMGSSTVFIGGRGAARNGDTAVTCNDPTDMPIGTVVAAGNVNIG